MILDIDAGNSFVKWRVVDDSEVIAAGSEATEQVSKQGLDLTRIEGLIRREYLQWQIGRWQKDCASKCRAIQCRDANCQSLFHSVRRQLWLHRTRNARH